MCAQATKDSGPLLHNRSPKPLDMLKWLGHRGVDLVFGLENQLSIDRSKGVRMATKPVKTSLYRWEGVDASGAQVKGEMAADSHAMIRVVLRRQGITTRKIQRSGGRNPIRGRAITAADITLFTRQLATLIKAGIPLLQGLEVIAKGAEHPAMRQLMGELKQDISAGSTLAVALRKHPAHFDALFCNLIEAGEQAGALELLLQRVATYKEKTEALKKKIKKAMAYPIAVLLVAGLVCTILLVEVVPQFQGVFDSFGAQLPAMTLGVIKMSQVLQDYGLWWLASLLLITAGMRNRYQHSPALRQRLDHGCLKLPILGDVLQASALARFARTLSTTMAAGIPLLDALSAVAGTSGNLVFKEAVLQLRQQVAAGDPIHVAMSASRLFPSMAIQMTAIGEESGTLDGMLDHVATYYENEVDTRVDNLTVLMEPAIMVILGVMVGGLVVAMYLPIFKLGQVI